MAPNVPPTRGYPGPMPPHGAPPPRPARRDGRTLPLVLIGVLSLVLIAALAFAFIVRPMLAGARPTPEPTRSAHPVLGIGERFDWGPTPPANLGRFERVLASTPPPTFLDLPLTVDHWSLEEGFTASYRSDASPLVFLAYLPTWDMYRHTLASSARQPLVVGGATCVEDGTDLECMMPDRFGLLSVSVPIGQGITADRLGPALEKHYAMLAALPQDEAAWRGTTPPDPAKAKSLATDTLPDAFGAYEAAVTTAVENGDVGRSYTGADGDLHATVSPEQSRYLSYLSGEWKQPPVQYDGVVCGEINIGQVCLAMGHSEMLQVSSSTIPPERLAKLTKALYDAI